MTFGTETFYKHYESTKSWPTVLQFKPTPVEYLINFLFEMRRQVLRMVNKKWADSASSDLWQCDM